MSWPVLPIGLAGPGGAQVVWLNIVSGEAVRVLVNELNVRMGGPNKADPLPELGGPRPSR